jgi:PAS domain S-box-containing protein
MTTLQQYDCFFDLVHDSVMTRTMNGIIHFWNHSAERLYGWRKEEAIGRVSHDLLQTQFPKPLEEIESELMRNGLWEGKLVHATRDGNRVVVESRWTLDPTGQPGAVVEINMCSNDPEVRVDKIITEYKQTQNLLENTAGTLRQYDCLLELVHDSVMTRTKEGMINFWNHSAERLYGWRKEEAIGRVSHDLLRTQFPKPLEEIESELARKGLWEGKLVHTTRDGRRVVVESRWTVGHTGQPGKVVEINAPSPGYKVSAEAATDSHSLEIGRQAPLHAKDLGKAEQLIANVADVVLVAGGAFCLFVLLYFVYYYNWTGQRSFTRPEGEFVYFALPGLMAISLFASLGLRTSHRITVTLCSCSVAFTIYTAEAMLALWFNLPSVIASQHRQVRIDAARALGVQYDTRTKAEVVRDFRSRGIDAFPSIFPQGLLKEQKNGTMKSVISINRLETLPLASIASKLNVVCNETGQFLNYQSDQHGFNNPQDVWNAPIDIVAVGDSYTQGYCVAPENNFVAQIRQRYPGTLNLGIEGDGPLLMLATLKEYAEVVKPKVVLWFYYEGNDFKDLGNENRSPLLNRYLTMSDFTQNLFNRQAEIDDALTDYLKTTTENPLLVKLEEILAVIGSIDRLPDALENTMKLTTVRQRLGLIYGEQSKPLREAAPAETARIKYRAEMDLLTAILLQANRLVQEWDGSLYFVFLPSRNRYLPDSIADAGRGAVLEVVNKVGLPVIDMHHAFVARKDPLALFPLRVADHYNEEGHQLVAQEVLRVISSAN